MDKNKLLNSLKAQRNAWNESLVKTMKEHIKSEASVKILENVIAEVEENKEDVMLGIQDILDGMERYCELFQCKCENCFFNITKQINSDLEDYGICKCAYDMIKHNVTETKNKEN